MKFRSAFVMVAALCAIAASASPLEDVGLAWGMSPEAVLGKLKQGGYLVQSMPSIAGRESLWFGHPTDITKAGLAEFCDHRLVHYRPNRKGSLNPTADFFDLQEGLVAKYGDGRFTHVRSNGQLAFVQHQWRRESEIVVLTLVTGPQVNTVTLGYSQPGSCADK